MVTAHDLGGLPVQVVSQLGSMFSPDFKVIKKRIEDLIDREYLERDKGQLQPVPLPGLGASL